MKICRDWRASQGLGFRQGSGLVGSLITTVPNAFSSVPGTLYDNEKCTEAMAIMLAIVSINPCTNPGSTSF